MGAMNKLRTQMAQQFLDALTQGQLPWKACWQQSRPVNAVTGKQYRGINALYLSYCADELGYADPRWCTYKQAQEKGWQVRRGEESCKVEYWAYYDLKQKKLLPWQEVRDLLKMDPDYQANLQLRSRIYSVFNAEQIDGIPEIEKNQTSIGAIRAQRDTLICNMGIGYQEQGGRAFYRPSTDTVTLPPEASFDDEYGYMATLLHECGHASGHESRLNRDLAGGFGSPAYAQEELRAEIASAFTAQALGLQLTDEQLQQHMEQHLAYVQHWASGLKDAPEELFRAIKAAEEISDYLIEQGEFEQRLEHPAAVYTHFYYQDDYLFTVAGTEAGHEVYDQLCAAARDMGFPWDDEGSAYETDVLTAPASMRTPEAAQAVGYTPYTEALLREHFDQLEQQAEEAAEGFYQEEPGAKYRLFPAQNENLINKGEINMSHQEISNPQGIMTQLSERVELECAENSLSGEITVKAEAHEKFLQETSDRGRYTDACGNVLPHPSSMMTSPGTILELVPQYPWANREQLDEIATGIRDGLTAEQVAIYGRAEFSAIQMNSLRYALESGLTPAQIDLVARPDFDSVQMDIVRASFSSGMTMEQVKAFARPEYTAQEMLDAHMAIREGREWTPPEQISNQAAPLQMAEADYLPEFGD